MKELKTYYIKTYGCAMNYADSDRIRCVLKNAGLDEVSDFDKADLIVLNSCSVRKQAEDKIAGWGIKVKKDSKKRKHLLTGCMAVRHDRKEGGIDRNYEKKLKRNFPWLDYIVDITEIEDLPRILNLNIKENKKHIDYLNLPTESANDVVANIPISTGCNFFCSYCVVPFSRGELLHRDYEDILNEVKENLESGKKLICLVAQNVNSWVGKKDDKEISFAHLLEDVANLEGDFWITFISSNPMDFTNEIIEVISDNPKIMRWINIAVQSGSDDILQRMNRKYTVKDYEKLVEKIEEKIPDIRLTTDIIVGFPGETEQDFEETLKLVKKIKFQMLYIGKYSPRGGTLASKFDDSISIEEKKRREEILKEELNKMRDSLHKDFIGKKIKILVTGGRRGLSYYYHEVLFSEPLPKNKVGSFVEASVVDSTLSGLVAKVEVF